MGGQDWGTTIELGLLPETIDEYEGHIWQQWDTASDWSPAFKLLDTANPLGRFRPHLAHSMLEQVSQQLELAHSELAIDVEAYIAREKQHEASRDTLNSSDFDEEDLEDFDLASTDDELRSQYENSRENWQNDITELTKVRQRLVDQYAA